MSVTSVWRLFYKSWITNVLTDEEPFTPLVYGTRLFSLALYTFLYDYNSECKREMEKDNRAVYLEDGSLFTKRLYSLSASEEYDIGIAL